MFATQVNIKTHDHHPIFDVKTKKRVNPSKDIIIEDHVWIGDRCYISKGSTIKRGSVIGYGSFVSSVIPNNCIAAGIPAKVVRTNIAWERPLLNWTEPFYKPDASCIKTTSFWDYTNTIP